MGGGDDLKSTFSFFTFRPQDEARLAQLGNALTSSGQAANQAFLDAAGRVQTDFGALAPGLRTTFQTSSELDPTSQRLIASALADQARQGAAIDRSISRAVQNPGLARVLQAQRQFSTLAASNPLRFAAHQAQGAREAQEFQLTNAARLAESQQRANLQQLANSALGFQTQLRAQPFQTTLAQLAAGSALAALRGTQNNVAGQIAQPTAMAPGATIPVRGRLG